MKLYGISGVGSGRVGNMVYSVRGGEQIVRQYNPIVANPQTEAQVASRSRLKLMSQLAAVLAPIIAIPADGLKSKRNEFISRNYELSFYANNEAGIYLDQVQLTKSSVALPSLQVSRAQATGIQAQLGSDAHLTFDRIVYAIITKQADGSMTLYDVKTISEAGEQGDFKVAFRYTDLPFVLYAYGIRANDENTLTAFDNITADAGMNIASIAARSRDLLANVTLSQTRGIVVASGSDAGSSNVGTAQVNVTANNPALGTVSGSGSFTLGEDVTVVATPAANATFAGWYKNGARVSTSASYTFALAGNTTLIAQFAAVSNDEDFDFEG